MIDIIIQEKKISKIMILSMRSKNLKVRAKKSNDLYFKTEGVIGCVYKKISTFTNMEHVHSPIWSMYFHQLGARTFTNLEHVHSPTWSTYFHLFGARTFNMFGNHIKRSSVLLVGYDRIYRSNTSLHFLISRSEKRISRSSKRARSFINWGTSVHKSRARVSALWACTIIPLGHVHSPI